MEKQTLDVRGGMFSVEMREGGSGDPLLFLHGSGGLHEASYLDLLARDFHVYAPVHPGFGESTGLEYLDDIIDLALYYYDWMDAAGLESAHVVGHSLGGMLAAEVAALDPHRVRRLVLANPIGLWRDDVPVMDYFATTPSELMQAVWFDPESPQAKAGVPGSDDVEALIEAMYLRMQSFAAAGKFVWPVPDKGTGKRLHRISAPTLVLWGEGDKLVPPVYAEEFATRITDSRVVILKECAHVPMLEKPEEWTRTAVEFLKGG